MNAVLRSILISVVVLAAAAAGFVLGHRRAPVSPSPPVAPQARATPAAGPADVVATDTPFNADFIKVAAVQQSLVPDELSVAGKLALDAQQVRISAARVAGRLGRIFVFEGQAVREGEVLAEVYSADYLSAESEYLLARGFRNELGKSASTADAELRSDSEATFQAAANRLKVLGASDSDIAELARKGVADPYLKIRAPISGVITKRMVDPGGFLNLGDTLMTVANVDRLWLFANTYETDYAALKLGETLRFWTPALPGRVFTGTVAFIAPSLDPATHTLAIRCDVPNADGALRPEMSIDGSLEVGQQPALVVPRQAVFRSGQSDYAFVQDSPGHYRRALVHGRPAEPDTYVVTEGLSPGMQVVTDGGVLLNQSLAGS